VSDPNLPATVNLTAYHGDSWTQTFRLKYEAVPVDLTGATIAAWAQAWNGTIVQLTTTITNALGGEFQLSVGPAGWVFGSYTYDVELRQGTTVTTWIRGTLTVTADITNPVLV
jgi:hypothetical protein